MKASLTSLSQNLLRNSVVPNRFGLLFWINTCLFLALTISVVFDIGQYPFGHHITSLLTLGVIFFLPGQNLAALIEKLSKKNFSLIEKLTVIMTVALIVPPLLTSFLGNQFASWLPIIPYTIAASTWFIATKFSPFFWEEYRYENISSHLIPALIIAILIVSMFVFQLTNAYYALPDLDPYYWLQQFQNKFQTIAQISLQNHRPLFFSFGYFFVEIAGVDAYAFFKYVIPLLFLGILLPATLIVSRARSLWEALFLYLLPFASASFLLYSTSSLPQSIANLLILFALYSMLYAVFSQQSFFYFLSGYLLVGSVFYHEMGLLLFLPWICILFFTHYQKISFFIRREWLTTTLLAIIGILLFGIINPYISFLTVWVQKIIRIIFELQPNLAFPATYINIDGNAVGWGDTWGVIRYYAFYFGPLATLILSFFLWRILFSSELTRDTWKATDWLKKNTILYFVVTTLLFFSLAEFFPRFFNVSLLPERALGFFACLLIFSFGYHLLQTSQKKFFSYLILLTTIGINIGAALYINSVKQYLITANQINSAEWIRGSLPKEKVIITGTNVNLLRFHAQAGVVININDPSFYTDLRVFEKSLSQIPSRDERYQKNYSDLLNEVHQEISSLENLNIDLNMESIQTVLPKVIYHIQSFLDEYSIKNGRLGLEKYPPLYIYYSKESPKNPYTNRPYTKRKINDQTKLIFDQFPERFERVYSLPENEIVIWKVIQ